MEGKKSNSEQHSCQGQIDPISGRFSSKGKNNPHIHRKTFIHSLIIFSMQKNGSVTTLQPKAQQNRPVEEQVGWIAL